MSSATRDGGSARRKSFGFFTRPTILHDTDPASPWSSRDPTTLWSSRDPAAKPRPKSAFFSSGAGGYQEYTTVVSSSIAPRPRVLTKNPAQRPRSMFGSLRSRDRDSTSSKRQPASSASSSIDSTHSDVLYTINPNNKVVVHSGEAISTGGLLRRRREYIVLTNAELLRYKSEQKASEAFGIPTRLSATGRTPSIGSVGDLGNEGTLVTMMNQVVAIYRFGGDADLACSIQVDHLDDLNGAPSTMMLQVGTPGEAQKWLDNLRQISRYSRIVKNPPSFSDSAVQHIARRLEAEKDYSPSHFQIFRVVQRAGKMHNHKCGSAEDLQKMYSTICYLVVGIHKIHLVPIPKITPNRSSTSLISTVTSSSYGILNLVGLSISDSDDSFSLTFR